MFQKLIEIIKEALSKLKASDGDKGITSQELYQVSNKMQRALDLWIDMYADEAPWIDSEKGIFSYGIPSSICEELARYVLTEANIHICEPGEIEDDKAHDLSKDSEIATRAQYLDDVFHKRLFNKLRDVLEKAMARGGCVIKPYISGNSIHYDVCYQGEFVPIAFDDDDNIIDIAFLDTFIDSGVKFSKVERYRFDENSKTITVTNKAYKNRVNAELEITELGIEVPLLAVKKWENIAPEVTIEGIDRPLFGYYKVPIANNIDIDCPLGVSVFHKSSRLIEKADTQASRLDWEYFAGQMAIDVDPTAINPKTGYYGGALLNDVRNRVFRGIDTGGLGDTYHEFAPSLRDSNYINGLNLYLMRIEDICGVARGTISNVDNIAKTATEIVSSKQKTLVTTRANQEALQNCIENVIYATNVLADLYKEELDSKDGVYTTNCEWSDSAIVDTYTELEQKLTLVNSGMLSKAEVRSWYLGEDLETAKANIAEISKESTGALMNDLFSAVPQTTLEMD